MTTFSKDKKTRILNAAAAQFAERPFHKVLLDDVARAAGVGKGTLYLYFESKDELFLSVLFQDFAALVERLEENIEANEDDPAAQMSGLIHELTQHLYSKTVFFELSRGAIVNCPNSDEWANKRAEMRTLIMSVINNGIEKGVFSDPDPALTASYIAGLIRSACLNRPTGTAMESIFEHARDFVLKALRAA